MAKILIIIVCLIPLIITAQVHNEKNFYTYFKKTGEIKLSEKVIVCEIRVLDYSDNQFLVTDIYGKKVFLFDAKTGNLNCELDANKTSPGFNWIPSAAFFSKDEIFVSNNGPWGFRFNKRGIGIGPMSSRFIGTPYYCFQSNGNIVGLYFAHKSGGANYLSLMQNNGNEINKSNKVTFEFPNLEYRLTGNAIIADENDNIYHISCCDWEINKYDKNLNYVGKIEFKTYIF